MTWLTYSGAAVEPLRPCVCSACQTFSLDGREVRDAHNSLVPGFTWGELLRREPWRAGVGAAGGTPSFVGHHHVGGGGGAAQQAHAANTYYGGGGGGAAQQAHAATLRVPPAPRCTCGATKATGAPAVRGAGHSDWCDVEGA